VLLSIQKAVPANDPEGYSETSAAPKPPPTGASLEDFGRERLLLRGGDKKLARSTVVELAVIR
jgi:hypothetical protein